MKECTCPVIIIKCKPNHVDEQQAKYIADLTNAMVNVQFTDGDSVTVFGRHRYDCDCHSNLIINREEE